MNKPENSLDNLKKQRTVYRATFTRLINKVSNDLSLEDPNFNELEASVNLIEDKDATLKTLNELILSKLIESDIDEQVLHDEISGCDDYTNRLYLIRSKYEHLLKARYEHDSQVSSQNSQISGNRRVKIRLPTIELVKFNGDIKNWLCFWSQFKKIHDDNELTDEEKFQYLIQATEPESRARVIVSSFPPTGENYEKAIDSLKTRFGREDLQIEVYVRELLNITL